MKKTDEVNFLKYLIFLIPLFYALNVTIFHYILSYPFSIFSRIVAIVGIITYPVLSALIFYKDKILIWTAPVIAIIVTVCPKYDIGGDQLTQMLLYGGLLLYIPFCLVCTIVAVLLRRWREKSNSP